MTRPITPTPVLPAEILDTIVEYLHDEQRCLLALSLVCRRTLRRSRPFLFDTLVIQKSRQFDRFLDLLEGPTTIASVIKAIHIKPIDSCHNHTLDRYMPEHSLALIRLQSVHLALFDWPRLPRHLQSFVLTLSTSNVSIEHVSFYEGSDFLEFFNSRLIRECQHLSIHDIQLDDDIIDFPNYLETFPIFRKGYHISAIDSSSLLNFYGVWDPRNRDTSKQVDCFYLRLKGMNSVFRQVHLAFIQRFVTHVGPSLDRLCVELGDDSSIWPLYTQFDYSACSALKAVYLGIYDVNEQLSGAMDATFHILKSLSSSIEVVGIIFDARAQNNGSLYAALRTISWVAMLQEMQHIFPSLQRIEIKIGGYDLDKNVLVAQVDILARDIARDLGAIPAVFKASFWTPLSVSTERVDWKEFSGLMLMVPGC
ncbi:hypothetical protein H0H92_005705 [Tricholoma furcatifolium]|nr:hypothetical protein H0H92_005705 [Tricholoma furcatifolium]